MAIVSPSLYGRKDNHCCFVESNASPNKGRYFIILSINTADGDVFREKYNVEVLWTNKFPSQQRSLNAVCKMLPIASMQLNKLFPFSLLEVNHGIYLQLTMPKTETGRIGSALFV